MNIKELRAILNELSIPNRYYSINGNISSDTYIFQQVYNYWECFYIDERGNQNDYHRFYHESDACIYFLNTLKTEMSY